jgi:hypothetical protein
MLSNNTIFEWIPYNQLDEIRKNSIIGKMVKQVNHVTVVRHTDSHTN